MICFAIFMHCKKILAKIMLNSPDLLNDMICYEMICYDKQTNKPLLRAMNDS